MPGLKVKLFEVKDIENELPEYSCPNCGFVADIAEALGIKTEEFMRAWNEVNYDPKEIISHINDELDITKIRIERILNANK